MNRKEAKEYLPIIKAFAEGKTIEFYVEGMGIWQELNEPSFDLDANLYRIKSELKYRPFLTQEECWNEMLKHHPFGWIRGNIKYYLISTLNDVGIWLSDKVSYTFRESIDNFTFADGTPFGIKEE